MRYCGRMPSMKTLTDEQIATIHRLADTRTPGVHPMKRMRARLVQLTLDDGDEADAFEPGTGYGYRAKAARMASELFAR